MEAIAEKLNSLIQQVPQKIKNLAVEDLSKRPAQNKWSGKEILGHLCDSAVNNLQRFIRVQFEDQPFVITAYEQEKWVSVQKYQDTSINDIMELWVCLNRQIARIITGIPREKYLYLCKIDNSQTVTLQALVEDYLDHMNHHLTQIYEKN